MTLCISYYFDSEGKMEIPAMKHGVVDGYLYMPDMQNNIEAVLDVMKYIYTHIMYAELNTKSDYCQVCGFDGEISIISDSDSKLVWECPMCKNGQKIDALINRFGYSKLEY